MKEDENSQTPGSCKGHFSNKEEPCKICILSEKCRVITWKKEKKEKAKSSKKSKKTSKISVPYRIKQVYASCVKKISKLVPYDDVKKSEKRIIFRRVIKGKIKNIFVVEMALDSNTSKWMVVARSAKGWKRTFRQSVDGVRQLNVEKIERTGAKKVVK